MSDNRIADFINTKFCSAKTQQELKFYNFGSVDWVKRTKKTIDEFLPLAPDLAAFVYDSVPKTLNSAFTLKDLFESKKKKFEELGISSDWISTFEKQLEFNTAIAGSLESQQVSAEIQRQVINWNGLKSKIFQNGNSIYPDLIFSDRDYSNLPMQDRTKKVVQGPCLQGKKNPKPSNVPDGIELKTNQNRRVRVDAHAPHIGLHLAFTWEFNNLGKVQINGAWLGFITESDHKEANRRSTTTTVKYSFGHDKFISLLR